MTVRAKFRVDSIASSLQTRYEQVEGKSVPVQREVQTLTLNAVYDPNPNSENGKFWAASPGGTITLTCVNAEAVAEFKLGGEMYIDFTPAD